MATFAITPFCSPHGPDFATLDVRVGQNLCTVQLPLIDALTFYLIPRGFAKITVSSSTFAVMPNGPIDDLWARLRAKLVIKRKKILRFGAFDIIATGPKSARKSFTKLTRAMRDSGYPLDGQNVRRHPELVRGWCNQEESANSTKHRAATGEADTAVVAHIYYEDLWPDIAAVLDRIDRPFDLIVTTVAGRDRLVSAICSSFPKAEIRIVDNRGRDVRPFLLLLEEGRLDRYSYVCKIHGKKSSDSGRNPWVGKIWRNHLLFDLLSAPGIVDHIAKRFTSEPRLGMIGSRAYRLPNALSDARKSWGANRDLVLHLGEQMGVAPANYRLDFFGGTMFWARPAALAPLRRLALAATFPEEKGWVDGALEHAVERLFGAAVTVSGFVLDSIDGAPPESGSRHI